MPVDREVPSMLGRNQLKWHGTSDGGDRQKNVVTSCANSYHKNGRQQNQTYHDNPRTSFTFDNHKGGSNGDRGRGQRGRGGGRGNTMRGGGPSVRGGGGMVPSATTLVNGIMVPKFGPGAFEVLKTAQANSSNAQLPMSNLSHQRRETPPKDLQTNEGTVTENMNLPVDNKNHNQLLTLGSRLKPDQNW
ncbi:uncharacterized protein MELLADRAFT_114295 [Melampsora larici-populina 98AG31]|uniref:Uncharacterized protein n=1 Tax=Melampsora larici-populina (strain 98AG31 / pathotype 3-4-7) TaxID=747676 RepID=F4SCX8_MELLP|nr:uncharacterized protein MELLADRAFT_114295 [Melampsora larici-populina 98AG31]EGF97500.1 hypothetical protein MELLADRAFT_114295 [Melampsora larici-populina 98AG31]